MPLTRSKTVPTLALLATALISTNALAHRPLPGHLSGHIGPYLQPYHAPAEAMSGIWTPLTNGFPGATPDTSVLLTDGTVLMHDACTSDWYKLTPDNSGSYHNGTWKKAASMAAAYTPLYFASEVLPDGRVIVNGGEYNTNCNSEWTTLGALYDPVADSWTPVIPPVGWSTIGDAQSAVRADGTYMLADCCSTDEALATISGATVTWTATGTGKADENDEEGWTILPDQTILSVDANTHLSGDNLSELYNPTTGAWTAGNPTANQVVDRSSHELGPAPLLPTGVIFQFGATPHTDVYDPLTGNWTAGPDMPTISGKAYDVADGPAAVLPDGNILVQASPGVFASPSHFFEVSVTSRSGGQFRVKMTRVNEPSQAAQMSSYEGRLMVLPTGEVLWASDQGDVEIYTPQGKANAAWMPTITSSPAQVKHGGTNYAIQGTLFNGLTQAGYYGDDAQESTNYPIVRIINIASGHVCYARTHDHSSMGISVSGAPTSTEFDVPKTCETGVGKIEVVANGIASPGVRIKVK